jgi:hypothetical protein
LVDSSQEKGWGGNQTLPQNKHFSHVDWKIPFFRAEQKTNNSSVKVGGWVAKLVARSLATAALWVGIQPSLKNPKWATKEKEWPTHSSPPKNLQKSVKDTLE